MARVILVCDDPDNPDDAKRVTRYTAAETRARRAVIEAAKNVAHHWRGIDDPSWTPEAKLKRAVAELERLKGGTP